MHLSNSLAWRDHFRRNALLDNDLSMPRHRNWPTGERRLLGPSLAVFQLGESSDGRHLLTYARRFGEATADPWLAETVALFIDEENRHARWLGEFLQARGYPLRRRSWSDALFRFARKPMGFGLMVAVLVCAEVVAVPYYGAVARATSSAELRGICERLLRDEAHHLRFQAGNLAAVWQQGGTSWTAPWHLWLQAVMCAGVWLEHGAVLRAGGYGFRSFTRECERLLEEVHLLALAGVRTPAMPPAAAVVRPAR